MTCSEVSTAVEILIFVFWVQFCGHKVFGGSITANFFFFLLRTFPHYCGFFLNHSGFLDHIQLTHTVRLLWTSDQPVAEASTYTGQQYIETQETNIHALSGIRTRDPSNQAAADLRTSIFIIE
jgi:hypothetical protein